MSRARSILIVTGECDPQADQMVVELRRRGETVVRLHPESLATQTTLHTEVGGGAVRSGIVAYGRATERLDVKSVWYRKPQPVRFPEGMPVDEREFAQGELAHFCNGFLDALDAYWVSRPDLMRRASWKTTQLKAAVELGFDVPRTLVSNDASRIREFVASCTGRVVYKTLQSPVIGGTRACFTSVVTPASLEALDRIAVTAGIFQEYVEKRFELRVVVIGDEILAFEIHSQAREESRIDWRQSVPADLEHRVHALPTDVAGRIRALMDRFGLEFGALDLVVTPDGRYVFLENNPGGQFGWLEAATGVPLLSKLADLLVRGGR